MNTRTFFHVDEYGLEGVRQLPYHLALTGELVVWCPLAPLLTAAHKAWRSPITPDSLIRMLKDNELPAIRIIGREEFLTSKRTRGKAQYAPAREWSDKYDGEIARIAAEDSGKPIRDQRVIIAPKGEGFHKADKRLESDDKRSLIGRVSRLLGTEKLPIGVREKAQRVKDSGGSITRVVLRDLYNHADATRYAKCERPVVPLSEIDLFETLIGEKVDYSNPNFKEAEREPDGEQGLELLSILRSLGSRLTPDGFNEFMVSDDSVRLRRLTNTKRTVRLHTYLLKKVASASDSRTLLSKCFPLAISRDPIDVVCTFGTVANVLVAIYMGGIPWSVVTMGARMVREAGRAASLIPAYFDPQDAELAAFLNFVYGTTRIRQKDIDQLEAVLTDST